MVASQHSLLGNIDAAARRRKRFIWLAIILVVLLIWWWRHPRSYHQTQRISTYDATLAPCTTGFLLREAENTFVLRDWHGSERWRTITAPPVFSRTVPRSYREQFGIGFSVSPNGHGFAAAVMHGAGVRAQCWWDNLLVCDVPLMVDTKKQTRPAVRTLDNGRVIVWVEGKLPSPAFVFEGGRLIARGTLPPGCLVAADGETVIVPSRTSFSYATLRVQQGKILLTNTYVGHDAIGMLFIPGGKLSSGLFAGGKVMAEDGTLYDNTGKIHNATWWTHETVAPGGNYTLQHSGKHARVYSPVSGDAWEFTVHDAVHGGDATADGRFTLIWQTSPALQQLGKTLAAIPGLDALADNLPTDYAAMYERPGRYIGSLRMEIDRWVRDAGQIYQTWWYPSTDGHAIVVTVETDKGGRCLVFRR